MEHVCDVDLDAIDGHPDRLSDALNAELRPFLRQHSLQQFIPLKRASVEHHDDGNMSLCYYHNQLAHDIVYKAYPEWIMMPSAEIEAELNALYESHGLDGWTDDRVHAQPQEAWPEA